MTDRQNDNLKYRWSSWGFDICDCGWSYTGKNPEDEWQKHKKTCPSIKAWEEKQQQSGYWRNGRPSVDFFGM